ncbi:MAG: hypothetical protein GX596_05130, partial [Propionibacterium sp.]|nr:hypothetical protein [Propionibacterium sp.]
MKHKYHLPDAAWAIAHQQDGVISHKQVSAFGFTRNAIQRVLDDRILWQVTRGLYSVSPDPGWRGLAWGGVILGGDGAALGGRSAG